MQSCPNDCTKAKKNINFSFPETSEYFLGSVGRQKILF